MKKNLFILVCLCFTLIGFSQKVNKKAVVPAPKNWMETVISTKKAVMDKIQKEGIPFDSLNVNPEIQALLKQYPSEVNAVMSYLDVAGRKKFLSSVDGSSEKALMENICRYIRKTAYFESGIRDLMAENNLEKRTTGLLELFMIANEVYKVDEQLAW
ncbi:MAG: hypothetical protein LBU57_01395, partial [Dysgonamonadaceae bacterium]|nr:hypothetical protein [Dysgonamonadaceae bacterium]